MRSILLGMAALLLASCASTTIQEAQPYGAGQFVIYSKSKNVAAAHAKSIEAANAYCAKDSKMMEPVSDKKVARREFEFIFTCKEQAAKAS